MKKIVAIEIFVTEKDNPEEKPYKVLSHFDLSEMAAIEDKPDNQISVFLKNGISVVTDTYTQEELLKLWKENCGYEVIPLPSKAIRTAEDMKTFGEIKILSVFCPDCGCGMEIVETSDVQETLRCVACGRIEKR